MSEGTKIERGYRLVWGYESKRGEREGKLNGGKEKLIIRERKSKRNQWT